MAILKLHSSQKTELETIKYFLPQALASAFLLIGFLCSAELSPAIYWTALLVKLGLFPFHAWFINIAKKISYFGLWLVSIPQKIIPFSLFLHSKLIWTTWVAVFSSLVALVRIRSTSRINLILAYSSLFNSSWLLVVLIDIDVFAAIFFIYGVSLGVLTHFLSGTQSRSISENNQRTKRWEGTFKLIIMLLNLGGVPPLLNIWTKRLFLSYFFFCSEFVLFFLFARVSLLLTYIYLRICLNFRFFSSARFHLRFETSHRAAFRFLVVCSRAIFFF